MGWEPFKVCIGAYLFIEVLFKLTHDFLFYILCFVQVTYTSDYFQDLYDLALKLIRRGLAYVDHQVLNF